MITIEPAELERIAEKVVREVPAHLVARELRARLTDPAAELRPKPRRMTDAEIDAKVRLSFERAEQRKRRR